MSKGIWWKALSVIILIGVFIGGLLIPLKSGIYSVTPSSARTGDTVTLKVTGYNTHYVKAENSLRAWLKLDNERALAAKSIQAEGNRVLLLSFDLPDYLPVKDRVQDFSLIIDNTIDGASVLPSAVFVTQDSIDPEMGRQFWKNADVEDLHSAAGITFPFRTIVEESIRNTYFHVPLWFALLFLFLAAVVYSIRYLRGFDLQNDFAAQAFTKVGTAMGILGLVTGAIWAKNTWGAYWSWDIKQNMTAVALLIYFAYFILRGSIEDPEKRARLSAVYSIFAFATLIPLIYIIPRMTDSLHPGAGGNPAFGQEDLDNTMRLIFYPAIIGWTLLGFWIAQLTVRVDRIRDRLLTEQSERY